MRKHRLDRLQVRAGHGENVRGAIDQVRRERLAAKVADVYALFRTHLHSIETRWLPPDGMHTGRNNFNVFTVPDQRAKQTFCDRAAADVTGADKEDGFHGSRGVKVRQPNLGANRSKSIEGAQGMTHGYQAVSC